MRVSCGILRVSHAEKLPKRGRPVRYEMTSAARLEESFRTRYWAAQHRHVAAALQQRIAITLERTKQAIARSKELVQSGPKIVPINASADRIKVDPTKVA